MSIFWIVIAVFYLALAIITYWMSRPVLKVFEEAAKGGDTIIWKEEQGGKEIGLESSLNSAFKVIIITDVIGFIVAAIAAAISPILTSG